MNNLTKLARVISDNEARQNGFKDRHEMYAHLDRLRSGGAEGTRETLFSSPLSGVITGALSGLTGPIGGIAGKLSEQDVNLELAARSRDQDQANRYRSDAGSTGGNVLKGALGGIMLGPLGGAIKGHTLGTRQQTLLDQIRANREYNASVAQ